MSWQGWLLMNWSKSVHKQLALTCQSLEEPALSSLWKRQYLLEKLVMVLPQHVLVAVERGALQQRYREWVGFILESHPIPIPPGD